MHEIECLKRSNPREFWRYFKSAGNRVSDSVSLDDFKDFFANLSDGLFKCEHDEAEEFCCTHDFNTDNCSFPELDRCITVDEIKQAIKGPVLQIILENHNIVQIC